MRGEIVAVDLETTGLDAKFDEIIEIGMVRYQNGKILDTYSTLVNPRTSIPERVSVLTGIQPEDVNNQPEIGDIKEEIQNFIGDLPILGHNVKFDVEFLNKYGIAHHNEPIDTYEMAAVLLPSAARYSLLSLTEELETHDLKDAHRALADALATCYLYGALWERLLNLPYSLVNEIVHLSRGLNWQARPPFEEALKILSKSAAVEPERTVDQGLPFKAYEKKSTFHRNTDLEFDVDEMAALIEKGGTLQKAMETYESRPSQIQMLRTVSEAFIDNQHLIIEAPTGTGKSMAYIIPSIYWALYKGDRVVISTATIALQDQLIKKDLPMLKKTLGLKFEASVLKGRSNYLCPRRLNALRRRRPTSVEEMRVLAKILVWLQENDSGDRGEINLRGAAEEIAWSRLSARDEGCTMGRCETQMGGVCPFAVARKRASESHILVVNHALLLSDVLLSERGSVIPEYQHLIIDEAHHLEAATTSGLATQLDRFSLKRHLTDLGTTESGLLGDLLKNMQKVISSRNYQQLADFVESVATALQEARTLGDAYFRSLIQFLQQVEDVGGRPEFITMIRVTPDLRSYSGWSQVQRNWDRLRQHTSVISDAMDKISKVLDKEFTRKRRLEMEGPAFNKDEEKQNAILLDLLNSVQTAAEHLQAINLQLQEFNSEPNKNTIYWCELSQNSEQVTIKTAPLHIGYLVDKYLWKPKDTVILTSATISTNGSFDYLRERLSADREIVRDLTLESPFDYENSTLIFIPTDIPEPGARDKYQQAIERAMIEIASALDGRTMGLFTSYAQLRQTAQNIAPRLKLGGITVYDQTSGSSRQLLIDSFKSSEKAVLLGTRSFWEGIDLPGDDLHGLVITRLPFSVPSDPIFAARSETFDNSFMQYAVPEAILLFRQGFGRLIRRKSDRGIVVMMDKRIVSKRYGQAFLDSLPNCTVHRAPLNRLGAYAKRWMERE